MSKKRKTESRKKNGEILALDLSPVKSTEKSSTVDSPVETETAKAGVFAYLKNHLWVVGVIAFLALGTLGAGLKYLDEDAQRELAKRANSKGNPNNQQEQSFLNKVNPFLPSPMPTPSPTLLPLSKSYVYAGSRLLAVEDANASAVPPSDLAIWRPGNGQWWIMNGAGTQQATVSWGQNFDLPIPGDYDGDGKSDFAVFRPTNTTTPLVNKGTWYITNSAGGGGEFDFGLHDDKPVPADYDGDGRTDVAVWRSGNATWYIVYSSTNTTVYGSLSSTPTTSDVPAPADYDGDGKADLAIFTGSVFHILNSSNLQQTSTTFGAANDKPVSADYDGDGKADIAVWRGSDATWYIKQSSNNVIGSLQFGIGTDTPVQNDYDGDGKCDIANWRGTASPSPGGDVGKWYIRNSTNPTVTRVESWGVAGDVPVPAFWKRQ